MSFWKWNLHEVLAISQLHVWFWARYLISQDHVFIWIFKMKGYYSAIKKNEVMPFTATGMDLENIILSEVRQWKTNIILLICGILKKKKKRIQWSYLQHRKRLTDFEKLMVTKGDRWGKWEGWTWGLGLAYAHWGIWSGWPMGTCGTTQGTLPSLLW